MRILFDNVNFLSRTGPNAFGHKLATQLSKNGHIIVNEDESPDVQLSFIQALSTKSPMVQRLDGIWFNNTQDWKTQNLKIKDTYNKAKSVVFQSSFDKKLVETFFGPHESSEIIRNGTNIDYIDSIDPMYAPTLQSVDKVWSCAASWRPHKRLSENVRYFKEHAGHKDCLIIAGANPDYKVVDPRIFYAGDLDYKTLVSLYKATDYFLHLAWLDHCPNCVVDARAAGCQIICSSSGGTREIAGKNSVVINEAPWDFKPCNLYNPPQMDFSRKSPNLEESELDIRNTAVKYTRVLENAKA
jgi:glycosyltransferase involved in cell wall biosynthesis